MFVRTGTVLILCLLADLGLAAPSPSASPTASPIAESHAALSSAQMAQAIKTDSVTIPTPGELFAALGKPAKPDWAVALSRADPDELPNPRADRAQPRRVDRRRIHRRRSAGPQQVKNIGGDIVKMAKALGVSENILSRGNSINQFAENDEWSTLQEELEATQNEVKASMQSHRDQDLVILVSLGGWIRGAQVVSGVVAKNYDEKLGQVLRQPELLRFIRSKIAQISPDLQNDPLVKSVNEQLGAIEQTVATPFGQALSAAEVTKLNESVNH